MKQLILLQLIIWSSFSVFPQLKDAKVLSESNINLKLDSPAVNFTLHKFKNNDTIYYADGKIKLINKYSETKDIYSQMLDNSQINLIKTVYQYDKCGNLRNISKMYSMFLGSWFGSKIIIEDKLLKDYNCIEKWNKPLIF